MNVWISVLRKHPWKWPARWILINNNNNRHLCLSMYPYGLGICVCLWILGTYMIQQHNNTCFSTQWETLHGPSFFSSLGIPTSKSSGPENAQTKKIISLWFPESRCRGLCIIYVTLRSGGWAGAYHCKCTL